MPHDMFGDVTLRPSSVRSRRSSVVVLSVVVHVVVILGLFVATLVATDTMPPLRLFVDYYLPHEIMPVVPPPPAQSPNRRAAMRASDAAASPTAAPLEAPNGIGVDTSAGDGSGVAGAGGPPVVGTIDGLQGSGLAEAAPPPPPRTEPLRAGGAIRAPRKLVDVAPIYPAIALAARAEGLVIIEATIDVNGNVSAARVLRSHPLLEQAALDAVRQWKFTPTLLNGVPVPIILTVTVNFALH